MQIWWQLWFRGFRGVLIGFIEISYLKSLRLSNISSSAGGGSAQILILNYCDVCEVGVVCLRLWSTTNRIINTPHYPLPLTLNNLQNGISDQSSNILSNDFLQLFPLQCPSMLSDIKFILSPWGRFIINTSLLKKLYF